MIVQARITKLESGARYYVALLDEHDFAVGGEYAESMTEALDLVRDRM